MFKVICKGKALKRLDGEIQLENGEPIYLAQICGRVLSQKTDGDAIKLNSLATRLYNDDTVELDEADLSLVKDTIKDTNVLPAISKAQILKMLDVGETTKARPKPAPKEK